MEEATRTKTLWIFTYDDANHDERQDSWKIPCYLIPFYAASEEEVEYMIQRWIEKVPFPVRRVDLRAFPDGFQISHSRLPGKIPQP